ncbi:MAG: hypothetical protein QOI14_614 [Actinomycetota bacterium]|nr:hypothetical protein [Actinomycetota bacterium]
MATTSITRKRAQRTLIDRLYFAGVLVKGVDGALELALGFVLLFMPTLPHRGLEAAATRVSDYHSPVGQFISNYLEGVDGSLARLGTGIVVVFLVAHGAIKVLLVVCLMLRLHRVYPFAMIVLGAFLAYEIYLMCTSPGVTLALFIVLDAAIIYLVFREYRELKASSQLAEVQPTGSD